MTTGERIRECRINSDYSQKDVARRVGVSERVINNYEEGITSSIPFLHISIMATMFFVSPSYLLCWTDDPNDYNIRFDQLVFSRYALSSSELFLIEVYRTISPSGSTYLDQQAMIADIVFGKKNSDIID